MPAEVGQLSRLNRRGTVALQNVAVVAGAPMRWRLRVRQSSAAFFLKIQGEFSWIFDAVLHFDEKSDGFFSVDCAVIVTQCQIQHRRSEEHTSELQSLTNLVCRLLLEKKNRRPN